MAMINPVVVIAAEIIMEVDSQILMPYIDTPENSTVRVGTINVGGLMGNVPYVEDILENIDILAIQEHWLYPESLIFLDSIHRDFQGWGRSCSELNLNSVWRRGKGGIGFIWRRQLDKDIEKLENVGNDRIIAIKITTSKGLVLFIVAVYLPSTNSSIVEFRNTLDAMVDVIDQFYDQGIVIVMGDFNCHIGKSGGPRSLDAVNDRGCDLAKMIERQCLISVNSQDLCAGSIGTYFAECGSVQTTTDHILMRKDSVHLVKSCFVSDDHSQNLSYHLPIICCLDVSIGTKKT